jgi:predicted metalloprotease with PDZ domain
MNDFCKIFHGGPGGEPALKTYTFEDVVATLNGLAPNDWAGFLRARLDQTSTKTPIEALQNSGWKLVYDDQPNDMQANSEETSRTLSLSLSMGLSVGDDGTIVDVIHGGPSYKAGLGPGMKIAAVNGRQYSPLILRAAVVAAKGTAEPIQLMVANGAHFQAYAVDYHGGAVYPHIVRDEGRPDYLGEIIHPLAH